jgi:hypothetical protein
MIKKIKNNINKKKITKKKKKRIILLAIAAFALILFIGTIEFTSHSNFCASCHYMKPFYRSWESSSHNYIECNSCHYPPGLRSKIRAKFEGLLQVGRYWSKLYLKSKPWAEIPDESCLKEGCHDKRILEGQVPFKKTVFDHKIHFEDLKRGKRLRCTSCHSQIVQGEHITVTESTCFICHFKESEHYPRISDCAHCHHQEDLISERTSKYNHILVFEDGYQCDKCHSNVIVGNGEVPRENCYKCHWETERLEKYEDTDLMHLSHIYSHKIECNQCHLDIQHKIVKDIETISDCQACHTDYHEAQKILYSGEGGKGIPHTVPNIMLEKGLSCKGCHMFHEEKGGEVVKSDTLVSRAQACESCHGKGFARIMQEWEISTEKKVKEIQAIYKRAYQELKIKNCPEEEKCKTLLEEAAFNIDIVERGKGVHNVEYSQELLSASYDKLIEALVVMDSSYRPQRFLSPIKEIPTLCFNCHTGIEEINTQIFGLDFPHKSHLLEQRIQCDTCHSNVRKHGEFVATKQSCAVCHHRDIKKDCTSCHHLQSTFYQGGELNGLEVTKDIMAEAEVECLECHLGPQDTVARAHKNKCVDCHDEDYAEMFTEWQKTIQDLVKDLRISIRDIRRSELSSQQRIELSKIEQFIRIIELDGSSGVHNYQFVEENLTTFINNVESLKIGSQ